MYMPLVHLIDNNKNCIPTQNGLLFTLKTNTSTCSHLLYTYIHVLYSNKGQCHADFVQ